MTDSYALDLRMTWNLFRMALRDKYLGAGLGLLWAALNPLLMLGMYTFIFGFVFKAKIPGAETTFAYALWLISGLVPYQAFNEGVMTGTNSLIGGANLIKNVVFRAETLIFAAALTALIPLAVGLVFLLLLTLANGDVPTWHLVFLPPVLIAQYLLMSGLGLFLGSISVFVRDIPQALPNILFLCMFFTPIFYSLDMLPDIAARLSLYNPLFQLVDAYRNILIHHTVPNWPGLTGLMLFTLLLNAAGLRFFRRLRGYFEAVL
ncbi:MAG: ABC transporter permease [Deltaproteobacteria bacterium]|jgi:lipopolysaccharide transport system permease protein|nr:ABC transporter permease [Deltaproteobacteria bacterium]